MKFLIRNSFFTLALVGMAGFQPEVCGADTSPTNAGAESAGGAQAPGVVRQITLPHFEPQMPVVPGHDEFMRACVMCHSPRYVTMQPPFSRHQWEETVHKMINVYGTPADEVQADKITDYLFAINGTGSEPLTQAASSDDDDFSSAPSLKLPEATESAPALEIATNTEEHEAFVKRGVEVFVEDCTRCHGGEGLGDGIVGSVLLPKPTNLTAARFSDEFLRQALWNGIRGTCMPSWRKLPPHDLSGLIAYVQSLHVNSDSNLPSHESLARGEALFLKNCAVCHGAAGDAKVPTAATLAPPPSNFKLIQPDFNYIQKVLRDGIPGTAMPPWKDQLSEMDRAALADYVRSLYDLPK